MIYMIPVTPSSKAFSFKCKRGRTTTQDFLQYIHYLFHEKGVKDSKKNNFMEVFPLLAGHPPAVHNHKQTFVSILLLFFFNQKT